MVTTNFIVICDVTPSDMVVRYLCLTEHNIYKFCPKDGSNGFIRKYLPNSRYQIPPEKIFPIAMRFKVLRFQHTHRLLTTVLLDIVSTVTKYVDIALIRQIK